MQFQHALKLIQYKPCNYNLFQNMTQEEIRQLSVAGPIFILLGAK